MSVPIVEKSSPHFLTYLYHNGQQDLVGLETTVDEIKHNKQCQSSG